MKTIVLKKNKFKTEGSNEPDFKLAALDENKEWHEVGACWRKVDSEGNGYLTGKLKDPYQDKTGYKIVSDVSQEQIAGTFEQTNPSTSGDIF